jgi:hypothetical protein
MSKSKQPTGAILRGSAKKQRKAKPAGPVCSFCGVDGRLIGGPGLKIFICRPCVQTCADIISQAGTQSARGGGDDPAA